MTDSTLPEWLKVGCFVDAKDSMNDWCVAQVTEISPSSVTVNLDGWGSNWLYKYPLTSSKLAPFRLNSKGYTGPKRSTFRSWTYSSDELANMTNKLRGLLGGDLKCETAFETTQFYRGTLFIFVENLLLHDFNMNNEDLSAVVEFFALTIKLIVKWLQTQDFSHYYRGQSSSLLYLEDNDVALASIWYELLETMNKLFALEHRVSKFFLHFDEMPEDYEPSELTTIRNKSYSITLTFLINLFAKEGGFDAILNIMRNSDENGRVPFSFIFPILLYALNQFFDPEFSSKFFTDFTESIFNRIEMISETELKSLKHEEIANILMKMSKISASIDPSELDMNKLKLFLKMLRGPYLEKRVKGLNEINSIIENVEISQHDDHKTTLSVEEMRDWILKNNLHSLVFTDRPHLEILKRSASILRFLARVDALEEDILGLLWTGLQGKHDTYVRATFTIIIEIEPYLSEAHNDYLFAKISELPIEEYDSYLLQMVKEFTIRAIDTATLSTINNDSEKWYGISLLKQIMLENQNVGLSKAAAKALGEILRLPVCSPRRSAFLEDAVSALKSGENVAPLLKLTMILLDDAPEDARAEIEEMEMDHNIKDLSIQNTVDFLENGLTDRFGQFYNIKTRLSFIRFITNRSKITISHEDFGKLWDVFVENNPELFFEWLHSPKLKHRTPIEPLNGQKLFNSHFLSVEKFPPQKVTMKPFLCFKWLFLVMNNFHRKLEMIQNRLKKRKSVEVPGVDQVIQILLKTPSEDVAREATKLLVGLVTKYDTSIIDKAPEILDEFTQNLFDQILAMPDNPIVVTRGLKLIKALLSEESEEPASKTHSILVKEPFSRDFKQIHIDQSKTIRYLRKEVARLCNQRLERTVLRINEKNFGASEDDIELSTMKFYFLIAEFKETEYCEFDPGETLSKNQDIITNLFSLLTYTDQEYADLAWTLLMTLPINRTLKNQLKQLEKPVEELIDQSSMYHLLYVLNIILQLSNKPQWIQRFSEVGGVEHLLGIYTKEKSAESSFSAKYEEKMVSALGNLTEDTTPMPDLPQVARSLLNSVLVISKSTAGKDKDWLDFFDSLRKLFTILHDRDASVVPDFLKTNPKFVEELLIACLIDCEDPEYSRFSKKLIQRIARKTESEVLMIELLLNQISRALESGSNSKQYWELLGLLLALSEPSTRTNELVDFFIQWIGQSPSPGEKISSEKHVVLCGILKVLRKAWEKTGLAPSTAHLELFLHKCLFEVPAQNENFPLCKHADTRKNAFGLLFELSRLSTDFLEQLVRYLSKFHQEPQWRTCRRTDWHNSPVAKEKSDTGFVGIKNLGCTCYMNSLMQQLFMITSWRESLLQAPAEEPFEENILYQLQFIMTGLKHSDKQYITTKGFTKAFTDFEGNPINVAEQMDVDEFFSTCMDRLENLLRGTPQEKLIKNHFGGLQVTELIGKDCTHRSERHEPFMTIPIEVKNKSSVIEGLESFVEGELLEGENAYQCDHCDAKVKALRRVCVKHLPNYLIIALRRFEFDFDTMSRHKVNDYCEFPSELNMEPYTQEGLERAEKEKEKLAGKDVTVPEKKFADDYYEYTLRGIVIHIGTAESGHYYSFIFDITKNAWFEFNDTWVRQIQPKDIPNECFGGEERYTWSTSALPSIGIREKYGNAYLLFYERKARYTPRDPDDETISPIDLSVGDLSQNPHFDSIKQQNQRYWRSKHIFGDEYCAFVKKMTELPQPPNKFLLEFLITILIRSRDRHLEIVYLYKHLEKVLEDPDTATWALEMLSSEYVMKELFLFCPLFVMRKIVLCITKAALKQVDTELKRLVFTRLFYQINLAHKRTSKHYAQYLELLKHILIDNPEFVDEFNVVERFVDYLMKYSIEFSEEETPVYTHNYLGYDAYKPNEEDMRDDSFYIDSKGCTSMHVYHLLYHYRRKIPDELKINMLRGVFIASVLKDVEFKASAWWAGSLYAYLCADNVEMTELYMKYLIDTYKLTEYYHKSKYLKIITAFLMQEDSLHSKKVEVITNALFKIILNSKYPSDSEVVLNYLFRIATKNAKVLEYINTQREEAMNNVKTWIRANTKVTYPSSKGTITQYEEYEKQSYKIMLARAEDMSKGLPPLANEWDSDEEITEKHIEGECDVLDHTGQTWRRGKIVARIGDMCLVTYAQANVLQTTWKDITAEEISAPWKRTKSY